MSLRRRRRDPARPRRPPRPRARSCSCRRWSASPSGSSGGRRRPTARPRSHLHGERRVAGERRRRARDAGVRSRRQNDDAVQRTRAAYRDARLRSMQMMSIYFATSPVPQHVCQGARGRGPAASLVDTTIATGRSSPSCSTSTSSSRPAAALGGVRPVASRPGRSLTPARRAAGHAVGHPEAEHPVTPSRWRGRDRLEPRALRLPSTGPDAMHDVDLSIIARRESSRWSARPVPGKSTLMKLVARFYDADGGTVLVDGIPIADLDLPAYRHQLGFVPQEPFLFSGHHPLQHRLRPPGSLRSRGRAGGTRGRRARVHRHRCPQGYLHPVSEQGKSLSAGERQLLCLARAPGRPGHPAPRRGHRQPRPGHRSTRAARHGPGRQRPHDDPDRPPPAHRPRRRPHRRGRRRRHRRRPAPTPSSSNAGGAYAELPGTATSTPRSPPCRHRVPRNHASPSSSRARASCRRRRSARSRRAARRGQVRESSHLVVRRIVRRHAQDLGVESLLVLHPEHADRGTSTQHPGNVGSLSSTSTSRGSPSSASVSGTNP